MPADPIQAETIERSRARKFVVMHWGVILLASGSMALNLASGAVPAQALPTFLVMVMVLILATAVATRLFLVGRPMGPVIRATLYMDSVVGLVAFYAWGEFETPAMGLLVVPIILAPIYTTRSSVWGIAVVQIAVYLFLVAARTGGWLTFLPYGYMVPEEVVLNPQFIALSTGAFVTTTLAVAMLAGEASLDILTSREELSQEVARQTRALSMAKAAVENANAELGEANQRLGATNQALAQFNAAISHDLRSPLQTITLHLEMLVDAPEADPVIRLSDEARKRLTKVLVSTHRLGRMIADLQELSRANVELEDLHPVDLDRLAVQVVDDLSAGSQRTSAQIEIVHPLPVVPGKHGLLRRVLQNLLENALKYGGTPPRVRVGALPPLNGQPGIYIEDNGPGIDPADQQRIFRLFERLERDSERDGTGAGLAIVHRIVQAHRGSVEVDRGPELGGARFVLRFRPR